MSIHTLPGYGYISDVPFGVIGKALHAGETSALIEDPVGYAAEHGMQLSNTEVDRLLGLVRRRQTLARRHNDRYTEVSSPADF